MANNTYGFDFLRNEHLDEDAQQQQEQHEPSNGNAVPSADGVTSTAYNAPLDLVAIQNKPDLEKQFDVLAFLQAHRGSGCLSPAVIYKVVGIDLDINEKVADMLQRNQKSELKWFPIQKIQRSRRPRIRTKPSTAP
jgi:hypothetical protein